MKSIVQTANAEREAIPLREEIPFWFGVSSPLLGGLLGLLGAWFVAWLSAQRGHGCRNALSKWWRNYSTQIFSTSERPLRQNHDGENSSPRSSAASASRFSRSRPTLAIALSLSFERKSTDTCLPFKLPDTLALSSPLP